MMRKPYKVVALCITKFKGYDSVNMVREFCGKCSEHNIKVVIFASISDLYTGGVNEIGEVQIFHSFEPEMFDAVVIMSGRFLDREALERIVKRVQKCNVPVISVDRMMEGCINITFDYAGAFEKIVRHVIEHHGITDTGFMSGMRNNSYADDRLHVYKKVLADNGIPYREDYVFYGDFWAGPTREAMVELINSGKKLPRAIICANDYMAIECIRTLREYGYRVPEDVIITGFDGVELEQFMSPRLTTAAFNVEKLCECIFDIVNGDSESQNHETSYVIDYDYREGGSCGCGDFHTKNADEQLFEVKIAEDELDSFMQDMYNMIAKLSNYPDVHYVFKSITEYLPLIDLCDLWLCFNDDLLDSDYNIRFDYSLERRSISNYTPITRLAHHSRHYAFMDNDVCEFEHKKLLPDIDTVFAEFDYILFMPLHIQGKTIGYTALTFDADRFQYDYFQSFLQNFMHIISVYINRAANERLYVLDVLTGIFNRHGFYRNIGDEFKKSRRTGYPFSIISIDMNGLKSVNDTYGHGEGDFALKKIAECMRAAADCGEICTRFGGDEFLIAFCAENGKERAEQIVADIKKRLDTFNSYGDKPYYVTVSCGIYSNVCGEDDTLDSFIKDADSLMYEEKKSIHQ